ncbi:MAG: NusA-like transcription termination signal-binding factor [Candidatus Aenigmarchaeota archaeon]|nr:NusA-like transcription termination signal-binding factor [Candidatus Aenigmarchaeota archaeon]
MPIIFDTESIRLVALFEKLTGVSVRDCIIDNNSNYVYFVIDEGDVGRAIGKKGNSVKNTENLIKKNIKIFEFSEDIDKFAKNLIPQANSVRVRNENGRNIVEVIVDKKNKAIVIGRDGRHLKLYKELLQRNHDINELTIR